MTKRLTVLVGMLVALLMLAVPALAQQEVTATGTIRDLQRDCTECAHHAITDEASGAVYELLSDPASPQGGVDLRDYVGERVTIHGIPQTQSTGRSDILFVNRIEPADGTTEPEPGEVATLSFELTVEGDPPEGTTFFGAPGEGGGQFFDAEGNRLGPVPLTDPDGDGVFTGSTTLSNPGTGPVVSLPVQIVQENGGKIEVIRDFGVIGIDGDKTFSASVSFGDGGTTPGPSPDRTATFSFELTVKGEPPADARFFGAVPAEGCISAPLTDPDGDGVFTGSVDVPRFPPGPVPPPDAEPVSLPVQIVQADGATGPCNPTRVIKDFGTVPADDDTFKARANFKENGGGTTNPEGTTPGSGNGGGSDNSGGQDNGSNPGGGSGSGSVGSGDGSSANSDSGIGGSGSGGSASGSSGSGSSTGSGSSANSSSGSSGGSGGGVLSNAASGVGRLLPSTGGVTLTVLGAGALLIAGGLLIRRIFR